MSHLCATCRHCTLLRTSRSVFFLCGRHADDPAGFRKYPRVPVLSCAGYEAGAPRSAGADSG